MPEIGTSGSMSGDGKRGVAEWPKLPRPSSTLPSRPIPAYNSLVAVGSTADIGRRWSRKAQSRSTRCGSRGGITTSVVL
jgi:hypothetical protein